MSQHYWELAVRIGTRIWPVLGPLVGIFIGAYVANRNQRKQWLLDNKRAEYRKLLTTLADCGSKFILFYGAAPIVAEGKQERLIVETARKSANVIYNRLFIAGEMEKLNILPRWTKATSALQKTNDGIAFTRDFDHIMGDIRRAALKDFS